MKCLRCLPLQIFYLLHRLYVFVFQRKVNVSLQATTPHTVRKYFFQCISQNTGHNVTAFQINVIGLNEIHMLHCAPVLFMTSLCGFPGNSLPPLVFIPLSFFLSSQSLFLPVLSSSMHPLLILLFLYSIHSIARLIFLSYQFFILSLPAVLFFFFLMLSIGTLHDSNQKVPTSNLGCDTDYPAAFRGFPSPSHTPV